MKAKPVPLLTTLSIFSYPRLWARFPNIPNIVNPDNKLVNVSSDVTIRASLHY